jgi:hypothetical protein
LKTVASASGEFARQSKKLQQPLRFLAEIPGDLLNQWNLRPSNSYQ